MTTAQFNTSGVVRVFLSQSCVEILHNISRHCYMKKTTACPLLSSARVWPFPVLKETSRRLCSSQAQGTGVNQYWITSPKIPIFSQEQFLSWRYGIATWHWHTKGNTTGVRTNSQGWGGRNQTDSYASTAAFTTVIYSTRCGINAGDLICCKASLFNTDRYLSANQIV